MTFAVVVLACVLVAVSALEHPLHDRAVVDKDASTKYYHNNGRSHSFQTNNGIIIKADIESRNFGGNPPVVSDVAEGTFSWLSPDEKQKIITVKYTADERGYLPSVLRSDAERKVEYYQRRRVWPELFNNRYSKPYHSSRYSSPFLDYGY